MARDQGNLCKHCKPAACRSNDRASQNYDTELSQILEIMSRFDQKFTVSYGIFYIVKANKIVCDTSLKLMTDLKNDALAVKKVF